MFFAHSTWILISHISNVSQFFVVVVVVFVISQYYLGAAGAFIIVAYIGAAIDNLLLSYLAMLSAALFPGLSRHGVGKIAIEKILAQVKQFKEKTVKKTN